MDYSEVKRLDDLEIGSEEEEEKVWYDALEEYDQTETSIQQSYVTVLTEEDVRKLMVKEIQSISDIYSISKSEATLLLPLFRRDSEFDKKWFNDATSVRESVGILVTPPDSLSDDEEFFCGECFESHPLEKFASVSCGHRLCTQCWIRHINNIINENPDSEWKLWLKCPYCPASVGPDMIESFASEEEKSKYDQYLLRSYVEDIKTMKWCPASECSCAIELSPGSGNSAVTCLCSRRFCWNCSEDVHSPVDCESAANWLAMNISDHQKPDWVLEYTVPCPKCKRRIEQNQDCSLKMKCLPPCNYDFCWHCLGEGTGCGSYTCNLEAVPYEEIDQQRKMAESAAYRYHNCYKDWASNELLMQKAKTKLQLLRAVVLQDLSNIQLATVPQLEFIAEAWFQIMESRRILKWTYAYEYYLPEDKKEKQAFLKHTQAGVMRLLEKLNHCAETELQRFLDAEGSSENFNAFRIELTRLTSLTRSHNESLVRDLEDGLANVVPASEMSRRAYNEEASGSGHDHDD